MNVLDFVMVGSDDHQKSGDFYDAVFEPLKLKRVLKTEKYLGYAHSSNPDKVQFYVTHPVNGEPATFGNGTQISFITSSRVIVDRFHEIGLKAGGTSEGSGGERPEGSGVYYSYVRDLDGNKICTFTNSKE